MHALRQRDGSIGRFVHSVRLEEMAARLVHDAAIRDACTHVLGTRCSGPLSASRANPTSCVMLHPKALQPMALFLTNQVIPMMLPSHFPPLSLLVFPDCTKLSSLACLIRGIEHLCPDLHLRSLLLMLELRLPGKGSSNHESRAGA